MRNDQQLILKSATCRLKDGRTLHVRLASGDDIPTLARQHPLPRDKSVPVEAYRAYYAAKCYLYVSTPGAGIVTGWVDGELAGFVFFCASLLRLRRAFRSTKWLTWAAKQTLFGHLGVSPLLWLRCVRWALQHFRSPANYRNIELVSDQKTPPTVDAWIGTVHTLEPFRRLGVAHALLGVAEHILKDQCAHEVALWAATHNAPALKLYESRGYTKTARVARIGEECWLMVKKLC
jgi:ribosomal protein S18 acetylase RimI-like enzyme